MAEVDNYLDEFRSRVDKRAMTIGSFNGEYGVIARIMQNRDYGIYYYVHFRRAWFATFPKTVGLNGVKFSDVIPAEDNVPGTSIPKKELDEAHGRGNGNSYIVLIYENPADKARTYYGCHVKDFYKYVEQYHTVHTPPYASDTKLPKASVPINKLFDMEGFKN